MSLEFSRQTKEEDGSIFPQASHNNPIAPIHNITAFGASPNATNYESLFDIETIHNITEIISRAYEPRNLNQFPCVLEDPGTKWWKPSKKSSPATEGFFFLKTHKTGSSTAAGIHLRIARNMAALLRRNNNQSTLGIPSRSDNMGRPMCRVRFDHSTARKNSFGSRFRERSFLWTMLREPSERAMSEFFHFQVSRRHIEPSLENFQKFLLSERTKGYYQKMLAFSNQAEGPLSQVQDIINGYDFIGVTERMDESAVALQMLLGLDVADVLFLNAKSSGGYDAGGYQGKCTHIKPQNITKDMKFFVENSALWRAQVYWDSILYDAAQKSLDRTIDRLGREDFQEILVQFRKAQDIAKNQCLQGGAPVVFPCSASRDGQPPLRTNETDCLWKDSACGSVCLDSVADQLELWSRT